MLTHYDRSSHCYQLITRTLPIFLGCTNVANSLVENEEFLSLIQTLDHRCEVPERASVGKEINQVMFDMKGCIQSVLADARKVSLCTGIPLDKILAILTDNGSNMIKAFCEQCFNSDNKEDEISGENEAFSFDEEEQDFESREVDHDVAFSLLGR